MRMVLLLVFVTVLSCGCTSQKRYRLSSTPVTQLSSNALIKDYAKTLTICRLLREDLRNLNEDQILLLVDAQVRLIELKKEKSYRGIYP